MLTDRSGFRRGRNKMDNTESAVRENEDISCILKPHKRLLDKVSRQRLGQKSSEYRNTESIKIKTKVMVIDESSIEINIESDKITERISMLRHGVRTQNVENKERVDKNTKTALCYIWQIYKKKLIKKQTKMMVYLILFRPIYKVLRSPILNVGSECWLLN